VNERAMRPEGSPMEGERPIDSNVSRVPHQLVAALVDRRLDPLFWGAARIGQASAWWMHVPFAHWVVTACMPKLLVELGTHTGVSYSAFCEAVLQTRCGARCYAIDTWEGDAHAGEYGEEVYRHLRNFHDLNYTGFSELIRSKFDGALDYFVDGSVDLIHIDGLHTYDAVRHDFETWLPKLSKKGVVLLHDTNVKRDDFGVYQFFGELSDRYPTFEFSHGHGLGIVAVGAEAPAAILDICAIDAAEVATLRDRFAFLGNRWQAAAREMMSAAETGHRQALLEKALSEHERERNAMAAELGQAMENAREQVDQLAAELAIANSAVLRVEEERNAMEQNVAELRVVLERTTAENIGVRQMVVGLELRYSRIVEQLRATQRRNLLAGFRRSVARLTGHDRPLYDDDDEALVENSIYFDQAWYLRKYPDVAAEGFGPVRHYLLHGAAEGRDPSLWFSTRQYLVDNPDVEASGDNALLHYLRHGREEGRSPRNSCKTSERIG
jgi:O-antigen biosynthesis protein